MRVGRNAPLPHTLWLVDVAAGKARELKYDTLPGIKRRSARGAAQGRRQGCAQGQSRRAHRDRWRRHRPGDPLVRRQPQRRGAGARGRQQGSLDRDGRYRAMRRCRRATTCMTTPGSTGTSTISAGCRDGKRRCGSCPSNPAGRSCTRRCQPRGKPRQLTSGNWEASQPQLSADGRTLLLRLQPRATRRLRSVRGRRGRRRGARSHGAGRRREISSLSPDGSQAAGAAFGELPAAAAGGGRRERRRRARAHRHAQAGVQGDRLDRTADRAGAVDSTAPARSGASTTARDSWKPASTIRS